MLNKINQLWAGYTLWKNYLDVITYRKLKVSFFVLFFISVFRYEINSISFA